MPIPFPSRRPTPTSWTDDAKTKANSPCQTDWRCTHCEKLLGLKSGNIVLIQFARGHQYRAPRPVSAVCRGCGTLNEI